MSLYVVSLMTRGEYRADRMFACLVSSLCVIAEQEPLGTVEDDTPEEFQSAGMVFETGNVPKSRRILGDLGLTTTCYGRP